MWELQEQDLPYGRIWTSKEEGLSKYKDDWMKLEFITEKAGEKFSEYTSGPSSSTSAVVRTCRAPAS